jgi:NNP family nitrate/nitrite transporter-like MFS transporter
MIGAMISATAISPAVGGWRNVFIIYGGISIVASMAWLFKARTLQRKSPEYPSGRPSFFSTLGGAARVKDIWLIGLEVLVYQGCVVGMQGYLPYFLQENIGWSVLAASAALAVYSSTGTLGSIPISMLSDHLKSRKTLLYVSFASTVVGVGLMGMMRGNAFWILPILAGFSAQANSALFATMCIEAIPPGAPYTGTALGLIFSMGLVGRSIAPPIGNSLANISDTVAWPYIFWAFLGLAGLIGLSLIKEKRTSGRGLIDIEPPREV